LFKNLEFELGGKGGNCLELVCVLGFEGKSVNFLMRLGGKMGG